MTLTPLAGPIGFDPSRRCRSQDRGKTWYLKPSRQKNGERFEATTLTPVDTTAREHDMVDHAVGLERAGWGVGPAFGPSRRRGLTGELVVRLICLECRT